MGHPSIYIQIKIGKLRIYGGGYLIIHLLAWMALNQKKRASRFEIQ